MHDPRESSPDQHLVERVRAGSRSALDSLLVRHALSLRRWARGRLPRWARGAVDTTDLVQDVLLRTFARFTRFKPDHRTAFRAYLRRAVENRIRDEMRCATRRPAIGVLVKEEEQPCSKAPSPLQSLIDDETWRCYLEGLARLSPRDRRLIVGRAELGYGFNQIALVESLSSPDAARMAVRRALRRLSEVMPDR